MKVLRLFKKFGKLKDVNKMNDRGVGLGLIICQQLCIAHKGKIWMHSREHEGSVFSFTMQMPEVLKSGRTGTVDVNSIHSSRY